MSKKTKAKPKTGRCLVCRAQRPKATLVWLVGDPAGGLVVDLKGKLGGRGVFVCLQRRCLDGLEVDSLARAIGSDDFDAQAVAALPARIDAALVAVVKSLLGLAQKSGNLIAGTDAASAALRRAPPTGWMALVAEDASPKIADRLCRTVRARGVPLARCLTTAELGDSIGKSLRSIVLIEDAGLARRAREIIAQRVAVMGRDAPRDGESPLPDTTAPDRPS